jgi:hypothetical protein
MTDSPLIVKQLESMDYKLVAKNLCKFWKSLDVQSLYRVVY